MNGHDSLQVWRAGGRSGQRRDAGVGHTPHAHVAVAPGLRRDPFHQVVPVQCLVGMEGTRTHAARITQAAQIGAHAGVAQRSKMPVHAVHRQPTTPSVLVVRAEIEQGRHAAVLRWAQNICRKLNAIAHGHQHIALFLKRHGHEIS